MKISRISTALAAMAALCLWTAPAHGVPIPDIFNTGVDALGVALPDDAPDPHWTIFSAPAPLVTPFTPEVVLTPPFPGAIPGLPGPGGVNWISPNTDAPGAGEGPPGEYVYELLFDLTGLDPATAAVTGMWAAFDFGVLIFINGAPVPFLSPAVPCCLTGFGFSASGGFPFLPGINSVQFHVINPGTADSLTGVQVRISGTADPLQVPGASTLTLLGIGMTGLYAARRRMKRGSRH